MVERHRQIGQWKLSISLDATPMDCFLDPAIKAHMRFRPRTRSRL